MKVTYSILNVTVQPASCSDPMETSECFMFGNICAFIAVLGKIGKSNSASIMDFIIYPLGLWIDILCCRLNIV